MDSLGTTPRRLLAVFVSLGGTKLQVAAIRDDFQIFSDAEVLWRYEPDFAACRDQPGAAGFCEALARRVQLFLRAHTYDWADVGLIGLGLPGPVVAGQSHSYNLTTAFQTPLPLDQELTRAVARLTPEPPPLVRAALDVQCDAAGELYHPFGSLYAFDRQPNEQAATVLNVATGIAAAFVTQGKVLISDQDFASFVDPRYDCGSGQIGRHLWLHLDDRNWYYHYAPEGRVALVPNAVRMTEYLSGPALAARLLYTLGNDHCLPGLENWSHPLVPLHEVWEIWEDIRCQPDIVKPSQRLRQNARPVSSALLIWADKQYTNPGVCKAATVVARFAREVVADFASALLAWTAAPGWGAFLKNIVLTGGVGIHFLASRDSDPIRSFCAILNSVLSPRISLRRSQLTNSAERGVYLFVRQAWYQKDIRP